ncbi:hypothetical protein GCM10020366_60550 [Saccharopolyspora gregorii]|uniref:Small ribosomal subunit protein bS6 n=2 Tax=Pseudonocardiaceae TaxID=2070 RepID=A0ABP6S033_9PSEU
MVFMRHYELMVILDPSLDERTVPQSLENFLKVIRNDGGSVEKLDVWGRRRLAFEIEKQAEGIYVVVDINSEPASIKELDRQLNLNETILRTKVQRRVAEPRKEARVARAAAKATKHANRSEASA